MKKEIIRNAATSDMQTDSALNVPLKKNQITRRKFVEMAATSAVAFTIVPRHVLGKGYIAPSDTINLGYIGIGTQGIRELLPMLGVAGIRVVAVCDPCKNAIGYKDWAKDWLKSEIRKTVKKTDWEPGGDNSIPGGRDNGKSIVDTY